VTDRKKRLVTTKPYDEGAVQTTGATDETVGGIDFKKEMGVGNLRVVSLFTLLYFLVSR